MYGPADGDAISGNGARYWRCCETCRLYQACVELRPAEKPREFEPEAT